MKRLMEVGVDLIFMDCEKDIPDDEYHKYMFELYDLVNTIVFNKREEGAANTFINHPELGKIRVGIISPKIKVQCKLDSKDKKTNLFKRIETLGKVLPDKLQLSTIQEILSKVHWEDEALTLEEMSKAYAKAFQGPREKIGVEDGEVFSEIPYGIFGTGVALKDENGYIKTFAVIQESGLYAGAPPAELRITDIIHDEQFGKQWVAKLNRKTDLPFYLTPIRIKVDKRSVKYTDEDLIKEGIELLSENL